MRRTPNKALKEAWAKYEDTPSKSRFDYCGDIPSDLKEKLEAILNPLEWLLPPWCYKCGVYWCSDANNKTAQGGAAIAAGTSYEYRHMSITFYPAFFDSTESERRMMTIHDLLHCITAVMADYACEELKRLLPEDDAPNYRGAVLDELERRAESVTQDLARIIHERLI